MTQEITTSNLSDKEQDFVEEKLGLKASVVHEIIRAQGEHELTRKSSSLWWSALAAGLSIGFSVLAEALLSAYLPPSKWKPLIDNLGYSVGFLIVILGHQQLFTENTLTAVLPVIKRKKWRWFKAMVHLWIIVLCANLVGCMIFALTITHTPMLSAEIHQSILAIGNHLMENSATEMFVKGIAAGWLIAALVWLLPSSEGSEFFVIILITYLIALGDFTHIIAGSAEVFYLMAQGEIVFADFLRFFFPTLAGNVIGGTALFAALSYAQVKEEI